MIGGIILQFGTAHAAFSPYNVEQTVKNNWNKTYGYKNNNMRSGTNIVYDVYSKKYTTGGYKIVTKDFGKGSQKYINFQGWAINFGYKRHTTTNHDTYIVAQKVGEDTVKIYKTEHINISATEDVEYNNQGTGVYNECPSDATKKDNQLDCNMRYDSVGFNAYLPIEELFPDIDKAASWRLYLVKRVDNHIVYTPLVVPFEFDNLSHNGGEISLSSGVNANKLEMIGTNVLRREYPRQNANEITGYFSRGTVYTKKDQEENQTAVWYGVNYNGTTRWASTAYWLFAGDQAILSFKPDDKPPVHISHNMTYTYKNGNDYWVQPNTDVKITLRQQDPESGNYAQNIRLYGSSVDARAQHQFILSDANHNNHWQTNNNLVISAAKRLENTSYGKVEWTVKPYTHGHSYDIQYYYEDKAGNSIGYNSTSMKLRVDGVAPTHHSNTVENAQYVNGNDYWVRPNQSVYISFRQHDPDSGNKEQNIRLSGSGTEVRSNHSFQNSSTTHNNHWIKSDHVVIDAALRQESSQYGKIRWTVTPKTHGHSYDIQYYFKDNVNNETGYVDTNKNLRVDGVGPVIQFRNKEDTADSLNRDWANKVVEVRLKFSDEHSGYKRSRYAWSTSTSTPSESEWSSWLSLNNYIVSIGKQGEFYLHVQAEDNVGNVTTTYSGVYKINNPPTVTLEYEALDPNPGEGVIYEGDTVQICAKVTDKDGDRLNVEIYRNIFVNGRTIKTTLLNQKNVASDSTLCVNLVTTDITVNIIAVNVSDGKQTANTSTNFYVTPLTIEGVVYHEPDMEALHRQLGHNLRKFYSGERFLLDANITNYPAQYVKATFSATLINGTRLFPQTNLNKISNILYTGSHFDRRYEDPSTYIKEGPATFTFEVKYKNGVIKYYTVPIEIIHPNKDDEDEKNLLDGWIFHRKY